MSTTYVVRRAAVAVLVCAGGAFAAAKPGDSRPMNVVPQKTPESAYPATTALKSPAMFTPDMPFGRAIEILRHSTHPPLNIVVLWRNVESSAGIDRNTPIGLDGLHGLRIRQCLELLLRSVSAGTGAELGYVLDGGAVIIATKGSLPKARLVTRVYDISDLVAPRSFGMMPFGIAGYKGPYGGYGPITGIQGRRSYGR
jgi:hypothetical protein